MEHPRHSYWHETAHKNNEFNNNKNEIMDKKFDILIIGAGLTGLNTAYVLKDSNNKIGIIEGSKIGFGTTGYTTAKITVQHELIYDYLINSFSLEEAKQYLKANQEGINLIKNIIKENNIDCDYKEQTALVYTTNPNEIDQLKKELEAYEKLHINGFFTNEAPLPFKIEGALGVKNQGQFNPLKYLYRLVDILKNNQNVEIYEEVRALSIERNQDENNYEYVIKTDCGNIYAKKIVVASHYPFDNDFGLYFLRLYQEKSYVLALTTEEEPFEGMYININDPVYSLKYHFSDEGNVLLLGGGKHKVGAKDNEEDSYKELEQFLKDHYKNYQIINKWSTQDCMTYDHIPYIGKYSNNIENIYVATGFKKWGMSHSGAAAKIISNRILGIKDDYSEVFNPSRITPLQSAKEFASSVGNIVTGFAKRIKPTFEELFDVNEGEGKIVDYNGRKVGVYKDDKGDYFCINPVCRHLKCALSFNEAEKTWDCQCHGSRYDIKGNILEGPTVLPLEKIRIKK